MPINSTSLWIALGALALGGCFDPADDDPDTVAVGKKSPLCEGDDCGDNGPIIAGSPIHRLHLDKVTANAEGITLVSASHPAWAGPFTLDVDKDHFVLWSGPNMVPDLVGTKIRVRDKLGVIYNVWITDVNTGWQMWSQPAGTIISYTLVTDATMSGNREPLCDTNDDPDFPGGHTFDAAVFRGEIYDKTTLEITPTVGQGWFNIACVGSSVLKTFVLRHARNSFPPGQFASLAKRKAIIDAYTGNFCGDGKSFTVPGVPLKVRVANGWLPEDHGASFEDDDDVTYEAVWNGNGAACLGTSRRMQDPPGKPDVYAPEITEKILEHCAQVEHDLPTCDDYFGPVGDIADDWADDDHLVTAFPTENLAP